MVQSERNGRSCWVLVGGRRRLGRALAEDLAQDHDLVLTSSESWEGESWVEDLAKTAQIRTLQWDAESPDLVSRMMADLDTLQAQGWVISGVVLLAGTFPESPLGTWTPEALVHLQKAIDLSKDKAPKEYTENLEKEIAAWKKG